MKIQPLVVSISARTLFDFNEEAQVFKDHGIEAYNKIQMERLELPAKPGVAFSLIKKLLLFNSPNEEYIKVIVSSKNEPFTGLRVFNSIEHYGLAIQSGFFTGGTPVQRYLDSFSTHLFLSSDMEAVKDCAKKGIPAARMVPGTGKVDESKVLRIAFDIDCVIFNNEAERVYQAEGLEAFRMNEKNKKDVPLQDGPFINLLQFMSKLKKVPGRNFKDHIRTALITSRGVQASQRPIKTLMNKGVDVDEIFFLSGDPKKNIIENFGPDMFLDDQISHLVGAETGAYVPDISTEARNKKFMEQRAAESGRRPGDDGAGNSR